MNTTVPFWIAFVSTVLLLLASLFTGWMGRRRLHLWLGPLTLVSLAIAIVLTEELMRRYVFPPGALATHLVFAKAGGLLALPVIVTGIWLWRDERGRKWHRAAVLIWLAAVLMATGTGLWMFNQGSPRPA
jgi:drug/metabolite transporter (DMT)-like permease